MKPTVLVVDDDPSIRKSLQRLLTLNSYAVKTFACAQDFYEDHASRPHAEPECLVLDVRLPDLDGITVQQELAQGDFLPIIFITGQGSIPMGIDAMKNGAVDFLPKPYEDQDLLRAVERALQKDIDWKAARRETEAAKKRVGALTPRELEVFSVGDCRINKQIARALGTTERTVKAHRGQVMQKMRIASVAELVRFSQKANIPPANTHPRNN